MERIFAVARSRGVAWNEARQLEEQVDWRAHADFMNALHKSGFVVLGGPLEETADVLLIVRAQSAEEIRQRLRNDPWSDDLLKVTRIVAWQLRLGSLG